MATSDRSAHLSRHAWTGAAFARLAKRGVDAVRIEVLARDLGVSKGSFYWHFRNRKELLGAMLEQWEAAQIDWLNADGAGLDAAARWTRFVERAAGVEQIRLELALQAWARQDEHVRARLAAIERKRTELIADVLVEVGFGHSAAQYWAGTMLLICTGWIDRASRRAEPETPLAGLGDLLSDVILAASARASN